MRRKKSRAKRRVVRSSEEVAVEVEKEPGPSKHAVEAAKVGNEREEDINQEIDCFKEEFEEVENVVSAVMEMDTIIEHNQIKNGDDVVENKSNFNDENIGRSESNLELNAVNGLGDCEKLDSLDVNLKFSKVEETMKEESVMDQNLGSNVEVTDVDLGNEIDNFEEAKGHANAEEKSVEGEPFAANIEVMKLDGNINDSYSNKIDEKKEQESRDDREQNGDIEVTEVNEVPRVFNHDSLTKQKKEKQLEIHVGGLHKRIVERDLFEIFGKFGEVQSARVVRHPTTKKSKGFAFIQYATIEQAKKVLSDLKDGIKVKGKLAKLSISCDRDILYLGNICKTWTKEDVLRKLKGYGIKYIDEIQVPNDPKNDGKIKGFAFLRFNTFSDAKAALHRLRKPDAVFGNARGAKVAFARNPVHSREEVRLQVKTIYVEGIPKFWDVHKLKEICEQYGETKKVKISRNFGNKGKDFGFISFTTLGSAVACVEAMNKLQYGGNVKVKAYIARPLVGVHLQKSSHAGLKFSKRHRSIGWWKMKGHARSEGAERETDMKAQTVINKSKIRETKEKAAAVVYTNNQDPVKSKRTIEGETNEQQSIAPEAHDTGAGLSTKPEKTDDKRKKRKRQRNRNRMHSRRPSKKPEGSSQDRDSRSSRNSKCRSHVQKGSRRGAHSVAYRIPFKKAYAASTSGYPGSAYGAVSGSKRLSSDLEPHAGFVQPMKNKDQYYAECVTPAFRHPRQTYAGYRKLDTHYERQPPAKYFKPAIRIDAPPRAGFFGSSFINQRFDVDDYPARRIAEYSGPDNQGPVHGAGSAFSRPYVPSRTSYARYEASGSGGGYHRFSGAYY